MADQEFQSGALTLPQQGNEGGDDASVAEFGSWLRHAALQDTQLMAQHQAAEWVDQTERHDSQGVSTGSRTSATVIAS
ncbi:hypothetical protein [Streptomyces sp. NPDC057636]|uniref:hypothetical protein n=1 Tax=Streptomyces sp. NPDC057636 TaxID=3346189 RepID=UPI0036A66D1B